MQFLYNFAIFLVQAFLPLTSLFSEKMKLFVNGRKNTFSVLQKELDPLKASIWFHAASLGEYEQAVPVMEALLKEYPEHQLVVTFFSPSGYEVKKKNAFAKATVYLPLDSVRNANTFVDLVRPDLVFFVKYEFWPNYLNELKNRKIRTFLLSGVFRENQLFFKSYGGWMRKALDAFEHFFLQDAASAKWAEKLRLENVTVSGDTRFDRVSHQIEMNNALEFIEKFKDEAVCVVCGSTWPEGEAVWVPYINQNKKGVKYIIAPHQIKEGKIQDLLNSLELETVRYSELEGKNVSDYQVLVLDTIGLLTKVYSYADIAYVGGAIGTTGLHNILEPATFGIPVLTGSNFEKFPEAKRLQQLAGLYTVSDTQSLSTIMDKLISDPKFRRQTGMIAGHFINSNTGATRSVIEYLKETT